jgi:hypothetical protein
MKRRQFPASATAVMAAPALPSVTASPIQRTDGFRNVNLTDTRAFPPRRPSGTAFFAYAAGYPLLLGSPLAYQPGTPNPNGYALVLRPGGPPTSASAPSCSRKPNWQVSRVSGRAGW